MALALLAGPVSAGDPPRQPALEGYCPAAYILAGKALKGDPKYQWTWRGELYYFSSADAMDKFKADPEKYAPQFAGWGTTALAGFGNKFKGDPTVYDIRDGKVYLFSNRHGQAPRARAHYLTDPPTIIARAAARWNQPELEGWCPAAYILAHKAIKGDAKYTSVYRGNLYHLSSAEAKAAFEKDPEKYFPQYGGYGTEGMSKGKKYPPDPAQFRIVDGKVYLFFGKKAKARFDADPQAMIRLADQQWPKVRDAENKTP